MQKAAKSVLSMAVLAAAMMLMPMVEGAHWAAAQAHGGNV